MTDNKPFNFTIVKEFSFEDSPYPINERARKLLQETFTAVNSKKKNLEEKLIKYVDEYPLIPQFKNRLASYYQLTGKAEKAQIINAIIIQEHPEYLFGKVGAALDHYVTKEYNKIPLLLGEKLELDSLYPERKVFQTAEVIGYYKVVALYLNATGKTIQAWDVIERLESIEPNRPEVNVITKMMIFYNMERMGERLKEEEKTRRNVEVTFKQTVPATDQMPVFENELIRELYTYDFKMPRGITKSILCLPEESLMRDLKKVLDDSVARYHFFSENTSSADQETMFLVHAIFIIAEKNRGDFLPAIFDVLRNGSDFTEYYMGDVKTSLLWIAMYKLCIDNPAPLFDFLKERNVDIFSKTPANQALQQLYYHNTRLQETIISGFRQLTAYFIEYQKDNSLIDTEMIADFACTMADIGVDKLDNEIKQLYENNLVFLGYAGDYESLVTEKRNPEKEKRPIPSIVEMYEEVITTWAGYTEDKKKVDNNLEEGVSKNGHRDFYNDSYLQDRQQQTFIRTENKIGRNDTCPCGSGKKYKKCCLGNDDN